MLRTCIGIEAKQWVQVQDSAVYLCGMTITWVIQQRTITRGVVIDDTEEAQDGPSYRIAAMPVLCYEGMRPA